MLVRQDRSTPDKPKVRVKIASGRDLELENNNGTGATLPKDWQADAERTVANMREPGKPIDVRAVIQGELRVQTIVPLLETVKTGLAVDRYILVVRRELGAQGASAIQAGIDLLVDSKSDASQLPARLKISSEGVEVSGGNEPPQPIPFRVPHWTTQVHDKVLRRLGALDTPELRVGVQAAPETTYAALLEVLSAADSMCEGDRDCGLPGLGIQFLLDRSP
jgi:hypothetical protein